MRALPEERGDWVEEGPRVVKLSLSVAYFHHLHPGFYVRRQRKDSRTSRICLARPASCVARSAGQKEGLSGRGSLPANDCRDRVTDVNLKKLTPYNIHGTLHRRNTQQQAHKARHCQTKVLRQWCYQESGLVWWEGSSGRINQSERYLALPCLALSSRAAAAAAAVRSDGGNGRRTPASQKKIQ